MRLLVAVIQDLAVHLQFSDQRSQLGLVIRQGAIQKTLSLAIQCNRMMRAFAHVDTDEDFDTVMLLDVSHACS
jgi:hypothetical protein